MEDKQSNYRQKINEKGKQHNTQYNIDWTAGLYLFMNIIWR